MAVLTERLVLADQRIFQAVVTRRTAALDRLMRAVTVMGDPPAMVALGTTTFFGFLPLADDLAKSCVASLMLSFLLAQLVKRVAGRPRPSLPVGLTNPIEAPDRFSFPSGHATATLAMALPLVGAISLPIACGFVILALLVGFSRCYLGVHYPGDVLAGWTVAGVAHTVVTLLVTAAA